MIEAIGLTLNFLGAIVLLGSDVKTVENVLKKVDPVDHMYRRGLDYIIDKSMSEELLNQKRAHPYDKSIYATHWSLWPVRRFIDRHVEQDVPYAAEIDIQGGWFKVDGEKLKFLEDKTVKLDEGRRLNTNGILTPTAVWGLIYQARMRRIYIYGVCMLALGFLLRLVNALTL